MFGVVLCPLAQEDGASDDQDHWEPHEHLLGDAAMDQYPAGQSYPSIIDIYILV